MKLILAQGETIQNQLRRLHDRDHQIEHLEGETHRARVETLGSNYLLETYLKQDPDHADEDDEEKGDDSGVVTEGGSDQTPPPPPDAPSSTVRDDKCVNSADRSGDGSEPATEKDEAILLNLKARVELWEKLVKVNKRLEKEEECLVRLHIKFRRYRNSQAEGLRLLPEQDIDEESFRIRDALLRDLERVRLELEQGTRELEHNAVALAETEAVLDSRRRYLKRLQAEFEASDEMVTAHQPDVGNATAACSSANDTDSNSDTGLSSLHSSSEEGVYVLDTLV
jgi:hypothetical protein